MAQEEKQQVGILPSFMNRHNFPWDNFSAPKICKKIQEFAYMQNKYLNMLLSTFL